MVNLAKQDGLKIPRKKFLNEKNSLKINPNRNFFMIPIRQFNGFAMQTFQTCSNKMGENKKKKELSYFSSQNSKRN